VVIQFFLLLLCDIGLSENLGEMHRSYRGVLRDLFSATEAIADDDRFGIVADSGEQHTLA
jgi:hypothetical protein